ncbi:MAG TPA: TIGR03435 family protein [Vicinamibacterales bacterium]|jgi:uncharacterized protein (TIGR03435 family)|nr:TIGR03435 family protein [Vicinamibacterales bacterium]
MRWTAVLIAVMLAAAAQTPSFDAVSIKRNVKNDGLSEFQMRPGGRLVVSGLSLRELILRAYGSDTIRTIQQVVGGDSWVGSERFDVTAATDEDLDSNPQSRQPRMLAMLRSMLADRFGLRVHTEQRPMDVYALVLSRGDRTIGPELHRSTIECPVQAPGAPRSADPVQWCGFRGPRNGVLMAQGVTMKQLSSLLAGFTVIARPVSDATGLSGAYDFQIPFDPSFAQTSGAGASTASDATSNLFRALEEQLGLRLRGEKAPMPFVVLDHADQPSEN